MFIRASYVDISFRTGVSRRTPLEVQRSPLPQIRTRAMANQNAPDENLPNLRCIISVSQRKHTLFIAAGRVFNSTLLPPTFKVVHEYLGGLCTLPS